MHRKRRIKNAIDWSLFAVTTLYLLSGLGTTHYRIIEPLTLGLLSRSLSFKMHANLLIPFLALLGIHLLLKPILWICSRLKRSTAD